MKQNEMQKYHNDNRTHKKLTTVSCSKYIKKHFQEFPLRQQSNLKTHPAADVTSVHINVPEDNQ